MENNGKKADITNASSIRAAIYQMISAVESGAPGASVTKEQTIKILELALDGLHYRAVKEAEKYTENKQNG